jgi:hypothetical protein
LSEEQEQKKILDELACTATETGQIICHAFLASRKILAATKRGWPLYRECLSASGNLCRRWSKNGADFTDALAAAKTERGERLSGSDQKSREKKNEIWPTPAAPGLGPKIDCRRKQQRTKENSPAPWLEERDLDPVRNPRAGTTCEAEYRRLQTGIEILKVTKTKTTVWHQAINTWAELWRTRHWSTNREPRGNRTKRKTKTGNEALRKKNAQICDNKRRKMEGDNHDVKISFYWNQ